MCSRTYERFRPFGDPVREDAQCPGCFSLERHRLISLFFQRQTDLFYGPRKQMLHVAPELGLQPRLKRILGTGYLSADMENPEAMVRMDITRIQYADHSFDVVYCSHVLEHVPDDRRAMRELQRVLKPNGWAVFLVPIRAGQTFEDWSIVDPAARKAAFGQEDHVRWYGADFTQRLSEAGFEVRCISAAEIASPEELQRMALGSATGDIFYCTRSPGRSDHSPGRTDANQVSNQ